MSFSTTHEQMLVMDEYNRIWEDFCTPHMARVTHDGVFFLQIEITMAKVLPYWKYFVKCFNSSFYNALYWWF